MSYMRKGKGISLKMELWCPSEEGKRKGLAIDGALKKEGTPVWCCRKTKGI